MAIRLKPALIRSARGMLNWSIVELAEKAGVSVSTVKRMEMAGPQPLSFDVHVKVRTAFEAKGVLFLDDNGQGTGLRFKTVSTARSGQPRRQAGE